VTATNTSQEINRLQNTSRSLDLLKAADIAHQKAQHAELARAATVAALALMAIVSTLVPSVADAVAIAGVAAAIGTEFLWPWASRRLTKTAMLLQDRCSCLATVRCGLDQLGSVPTRAGTLG
jgi:hypothetical protein